MMMPIGPSRQPSPQPQQALPYLQKALSREPSSEDLFHVLFYIAHTYKEMADFTNALAYCAKAEEFQPNNYELWNLKGFCHFKQRNHDEAIACFEKAIEIDPDFGQAYAALASTHVILGIFGSAANTEMPVAKLLEDRYAGEDLDSEGVLSVYADYCRRKRELYRLLRIE